MAQHSSSHNFKMPAGTSTSQPNYYDLLDLAPTAADSDIRRAYREKSKLYHPDTTNLPAEIAVEKFRQLNQAYAVLSQPDQRLSYDREQQAREKIAATGANPSAKSSFRWSRSAYLEAQDRPLSSGEMFALFILALTFLACLLLAILVGVVRGEIVIAKLQQIHPEQWWAQMVSAWPHPSQVSENAPPVQGLSPNASPRFSFSPPQFSKMSHELPH